MALRPFRALSVCAGIGGLDLGLKQAVAAYRTVGYVERDSYTAAVLVARMADSTLDRAPVWDDVTTFPGRRWRSAVDCVVAGFPCQPWSTAGQRRGTTDPRWLWPAIAAIVRDVRPEWCFLENVPGLVSGGGLLEVLGSLAAIGFDAEWASVRASDSGAPHQRQRVFILGHANGRRSSARSRYPRLTGTYPEERGAEPRVQGGGSLVHPDGSRLEGWRSNGQRTDTPAAWPPGPEERGRWRSVLEHRPDLAPSIESGVRGVADGLPNRVDRLRALGNAVVPSQAAHAFRTLLGRLEA